MIGLLLTLVTTIVLVLLARQDIRERMIFTFPIIVLHLIWSAYLLLSNAWSASFLIIFWSIHLVIYVIFNQCNLWGRGDSDVFLLFSNLCLYSVHAVSGYALAIRECVYLCFGLMLSMAIGFIENKIRHKEVKLNGEIAVVPGITLVMICLMLQGICWRGME
ncbi:MAG: hypothetical protein Q4F05_08425 [bacterium]|nr:hypothetical protein [bacterium]